MFQLRKLVGKLPPVVRVFLLKAVIIFVCWQTLYHLVLAPARIPDRALTNVTCFSTAKLLSVFFNDVRAEYTHDNSVRSAVIWIKNVRIIGVADPCNGLDIFVLYISFLFCFPGSFKRRAVFLLVGIPYIYIINTIRAGLIAWLNIYHRGWVDISHHYIFTTSVYMLVFYLWVLYCKKEAKGELFMVASLIVILILSWVNVDVFGSYHKHQYSMYINQMAHMVAVSITGVLGYLNWRHMEKWLVNLWLYSYGLILLVMVTFSIIYYFGLDINRDWRTVILGLRNTFTGPLPFLIFFLFNKVTVNRSNKDLAKERKIAGS